MCTYTRAQSRREAGATETRAESQKPGSTWFARVEKGGSVKASLVVARATLHKRSLYALLPLFRVKCTVNTGLEITPAK